MAVTFDRAQLIKVANTALAEHEKAKVAHAKDVEKFKADHAKTHGGESRERARKLRDALTKALKQPGPITSAHLTGEARTAYRVSELLYSPPDEYQWRDKVTKPNGLLTPVQVTETKALLQVLGAATGKEVTANELRLLGLKNLGPVFTAAAAENGKAVGK